MTKVNPVLTYCLLRRFLRWLMFLLKPVSQETTLNETGKKEWLGGGYTVPLCGTSSISGQDKTTIPNQESPIPLIYLQTLPSSTPTLPGELAPIPETKPIGIPGQTEYNIKEFVACEVVDRQGVPTAEFGTIVEILPDGFYVVELVTPHKEGDYAYVPVEKIRKAGRA